MYRQEDSDAPLIFMAGDSTLYNRHWVAHNRHAQADVESSFHKPKAEPVDKGLAQFLKEEDQFQLKDMTYWVSYWLRSKTPTGSSPGVINVSVEERALKDSVDDFPKPEIARQDQLVRENLRSNDTLLVSIGGNDILLKPDIWMISAAAWMWLVMKVGHVDRHTWGIRTFVGIFKDKVQDYIFSLLPEDNAKWPHKIMVMFPYLPSYDKVKQSGHSDGGHSQGSEWASPILEKIGYFDEAKRGQMVQVMREVYRQSYALQRELTQKLAKIKPENPPRVIMFAGYKWLDGSVPDAYEALVEPNILGGAILGHAITSLYLENDDVSQVLSDADDNSDQFYANLRKSLVDDMNAKRDQFPQDYIDQFTAELNHGS